MNCPMNDETRSWVEETAEKLHKKMAYSVQKAQEISGIPYTTADGKWVSYNITWWTNGFWPAPMWQMYLATKDECFRDEAIRAEKLLDEALNSYSTLDHDVGFMWLINSGVHYALEHNEDSYARTMKAAQHLACRCDFRQPAEPELKDCAAGAIAAAGMLVLSNQVPECEAAAYRNAAIHILRAMDADCADWSEAQPAILTKCTSAYHDLKGRHITMDYADYFFIEAINILRGQELLFWQPK